MKKQLSREEKRLIERQFVASEEVRITRRKFFNTVFIIGVSAGLLAPAIHAFVGRNIFSILATFAYGVCVLLYTEFLTIPRTFSRDIDPKWHLNPWREALRRLSSEGRYKQGVLLLISLPVARVVFGFVALSIE